MDRRGEETFEQGLNELAAFQDYNLLCEHTVKETLKTVQSLPLAQKREFSVTVDDRIDRELRLDNHKGTYRRVGQKRTVDETGQNPLKRSLMLAPQ